MQRGRGRARGRAGDGEESQAPRRPGEGITQAGRGAPRLSQPASFAPPQAAPSQAAPPTRAMGTAPSVGGRSTHRTVPTGVPGADPATTELVRSMAEAKIGAGDAAGGIRQGRGGNRALPETVLRTRPTNVDSKKGTSGLAVKVSANYFALMTAPSWVLYQYHVDITPAEDRTFIRKVLLRVHKEKLGGYIFDGGALYTVKRLHPDPMELFSERLIDGERMRIMIKFVGDLMPGDYHYIQVFNIIMRRCYTTLQLQLVGRDFFDAAAKVDIPEYRLQVWPGYKTTINQHESQIMMVAEVAHKVLRMDTILQMLMEYTQSKGGDYRRAFQEDVVGKIVLTDYNSKTYRVDDVDWTKTPSSTFMMKGEDISYMDYYYKKYKVRITDPRQPLLVSRPKPREIRAGITEIVLVPELCRQTGLTEAMRNNFQLMKALAMHTKLGPDVRMRKLMNFNQRLQSNPNVMQELKEWDMRLDKQAVQFPGRILPTENIVQGTQGEIKFPAGNTNDGWTRDMRSCPLLSCGQVVRWTVLSPERLRRDTESFTKLICDTGGKVGFRLPRPDFVFMQNDRSNEYTSQLENIIARNNPTLILIVLMRNMSDRYEAIKKKCCVERAVPTQVVCARNMTSKSAMSIATKVAIQINCKVGGAPWTVDIPLKGLMVIGYDVCHDTKVKERSFGAMVASLDNSQTTYFNATTSHSGGEEVSTSLGYNIEAALRTYKERNGALPTRILYYRDGVGEGQIRFVYENEVEVVRKKLREIYQGDNWRMAFVIVSKRINTRIFLHDKGPMPNNPPPGTIVDDVITLPERYDFFLVSQSVREGTVAPTSYNVIFDNLGLKPDQVQRLTYKMCHLYFNCSNHVRVPAVCQYAHKLAFLAGQSLHNPPLSSLNQSLFFL